MSAWHEKLHEVHDRHFPPPINFEDERVVARHEKGGVVIYGMGESIPEAMAREIAEEVFPLLEKAGLMGSISPAVVTHEHVLGQIKDFDDHCRLANMFGR